MKRPTGGRVARAFGITLLNKHTLLFSLQVGHKFDKTIQNNFWGGYITLFQLCFLLTQLLLAYMLSKSISF